MAAGNIIIGFLKAFGRCLVGDADLRRHISIECGHAEGSFKRSMLEQATAMAESRLEYIIEKRSGGQERMEHRLFNEIWKQ